LEAVEGRVPVVRKRVRESKVTTEELTAGVREWAATKAQDRVVERLEIERRTEKLSGQLRVVDLRLEASTEAVRDVRRVLDLAQGLGARVDPASTDEVLELLASLRGSVQQAEGAVDGVRGFATPGGESVGDRLTRVAKLLARILLTLSEVDRRLDDLAARLAAARADARQLKTRTSTAIVLGAGVCYGLLAWVAAGQVALCRWGGSRCRRGRST
jgi:hypothetical protein